MTVTNNCNNSNIKVFYKKNTFEHNNLKYGSKILTDGITMQKNCNLNFDILENDFMSYMINTKYYFYTLSDGSQITIPYDIGLDVKTIMIKSHLPNIGYYDITMNNHTVADISISRFFYNNYIDDNILDGLIINKTFSVQEEVLVKGDITAFSTTIPSDIRLKKDVKEITNGLEIINKLRPVSFKWKKNNKESIGFIAQEIELILPHFVKDTKLDGIPIKTIKQDKLLPYIVDSIKNISNRLKKYESI
tara:strand:+ start:5954 stop:6697 length:744 start_codon:yes stop_codon:yes gene_type:complete